MRASSWTRSSPCRVPRDSARFRQSPCTWRIASGRPAFPRTTFTSCPRVKPRRSSCAIAATARAASRSCCSRTWTSSRRSRRTGSAIRSSSIEENGYFFGRGTMDVKGEIALIAATFLRLKAERFVPTRDLIIAFSGDEETTDGHRARTRDEVPRADRCGIRAERRRGWRHARRRDGQAAVLRVAGRREVLRELRAHGAQPGWAQFAAAARQCHLRARRCAQGGAGLLVPGDVERLDDRQLQGVGSRHARRAGPGHGEVRG